jgi:hypothetical protein
VLPWIAPVALAVVFLLCFFPWLGAYPGGYAVYTQSAIQMIWGGHWDDQVTDERVFNTEKQIAQNIGANPLMFFYFLLVVVALVLSAAPLVMAHTTIRLPPVFERIWPWRSGLAAGATGLAFLIVLLQVWLGFGLENAITQTIAATQEQATVKRAEGSDKITEIVQGAAVARYSVRHTRWLELAVFLNLVALAGIGLESWVEKRTLTAHPLPQIQIQW